MIAAVNELSGRSLFSPGSPRAPEADKGAFDALLSTTAPEPAPALPAVPAGARAPLRVEPGSAAMRAPAVVAPANAPRVIEPDATAVVAPTPPPASAPQPSATIAVQRAAGAMTSASAEQGASPPLAACNTDIGSSDPARPAARKPGLADEKRALQSHTPADIAPPGGVAPPIVAITPTLLPLAHIVDVAADQPGGSGSAEPQAAAPAPLPASATPDSTASASDPVAAPSGAFGAVVSNAPHAPTPAGPTPAAAAPRDRAASSVARSDQLGLEIVRHIGAGREALSVALTPESLGRVEVQMRFDDGGTLRAVVSASTPEALALLHRDTALLDQAMASAGVRTDAQSFQFDSRTGGGGDPPPDAPAPAEHDVAHRPLDPPEATILQPLRSSGLLDLLA